MKKNLEKHLRLWCSKGALFPLARVSQLGLDPHLRWFVYTYIIFRSAWITFIKIFYHYRSHRRRNGCIIHSSIIHITNFYFGFFGWAPCRGLAGQRCTSLQQPLLITAPLAILLMGRSLSPPRHPRPRIYEGLGLHLFKSLKTCSSGLLPQTDQRTATLLLCSPLRKSSTNGIFKIIPTQ